MLIAISIAKKWTHQSFPNPCVGSLIVECDKNYKNDKIVGYGFTGRGGRPHAENNAINNVKFNIKKKYLCYSTLEPCSHKGRGKACVDLIIEKKIDEVIFSILDPDKRTYCLSKEKLIQNGIIVRHGILKKEALDLYEGYFLNKLKFRPKITLKIASSINGKITQIKSKKWITNEIARKHVHYQRMDNDAILIGKNTAKIDNPELTCRINGMNDFSPLRIIFDSKLNLSEKLKIFDLSDKKTILLTCSRNKKLNKMFSLKGNILLFNKQNYTLKNVLKKLTDLGISNLIVEGGAKTFKTFLDEKLVDVLNIYKANFFISNLGVNMIEEKRNLDNLCSEKKISDFKFKLKDFIQLDDNNLEIYESFKSLKFKEKILGTY